MSVTKRFKEKNITKVQGWKEAHGGWGRVYNGEVVCNKVGEVNRGEITHSIRGHHTNLNSM